MTGHICLGAVLLFLAGLNAGPDPGAPSPSPAPKATPAPTPLLPPREIEGGFSHYIPDETGDIDWQIKGSEAYLQTDRLVTLVNLFARSFDEEIGPVSIELSRADYDMEARVATAVGQWVVVRRGPLVLTGKGLVWSIPREEVRILEDVRVLIKESENLGLFPDESK